MLRQPPFMISAVKKRKKKLCPNISNNPNPKFLENGHSIRVRRWKQEQVLDYMAVELANLPDIMNKRKATVKHPFGTIKMWMGAAHYNMRRLKNVNERLQSRQNL